MYLYSGKKYFVEYLMFIVDEKFLTISKLQYITTIALF